LDDSPALPRPSQTLTFAGWLGRGPGARALWSKSIGPFEFLDFELRISDFLIFLFQSAFHNPRSSISEARPGHKMKNA
jgi:hypothetical protein